MMQQDIPKGASLLTLVVPLFRTLCQEHVCNPSPPTHGYRFSSFSGLYPLYAGRQVLRGPPIPRCMAISSSSPLGGPCHSGVPLLTQGPALAACESTSLNASSPEPLISRKTTLARNHTSCIGRIARSRREQSGREPQRRKDLRTI